MPLRNLLRTSKSRSRSPTQSPTLTNNNNNNNNTTDDDKTMNTDDDKNNYQPPTDLLEESADKHGTIPSTLTPKLTVPTSIAGLSGVDDQSAVTSSQLEELSTQISAIQSLNEKMMTVQERNQMLLERSRAENRELREQIREIAETGSFSTEPKDRSAFDEPKPEECGDYTIIHNSTKWRVSGYSSIEPNADKTYFPGLAWEHKATVNNPTPRMISGIIPCFNERGVDLQRTIYSLSKQRMPPGYRVEFVIVMDGVDMMDDSMSEYLYELFGVKVNSGDSKTDPFVIFPEYTETVIVEAADREAAATRPRAFRGADEGGYSLVLKKTNHRKANSQMWWLGSHGKDLKCEYALATDCGTVFDPLATIKLVAKLDDEHDLHAVTGFQRIMTSHMQGDGAFEILHNPFQFLLRMVQRFEFEVDHVSFKAVHDSIGYMSVIPGPCGLYRYNQLGTLKSGLMHEYFRIFQRKSQGLILGNVEIVEDRIPGTLLVFPITKRSEKGESRMPSTGWPRTGFVYDALFYVEAEKPLSQLVKQRRRWINGTFATYIWILREGIIERSNQDGYTKFMSYLLVVINVLQGLVVRLFGPALLIVWMYRFGLFLPDLISDPVAIFDPTISLVEYEGDTNRLIGALVFGVGYLLLYIIFIIGHTPRAKPVSDSDISIVRYTEPTRYASDRTSAYRWWIFHPVLWLSCVVISLYIVNAGGILYTLGWTGTPIIVRILLIVCAVPFVIGILDGCIRCDFKCFFGMVYSAPFATPLLIWFTIWLPAYASTRLSDLTWGNRNSSGFDESAKALKRAQNGQKFAAFLILCNTVVALAVVGMMNIWGQTFPIFVLLYTLIMSSTYVVVVIDMVYRALQCAVDPFTDATRLSQQGGVSRAVEAEKDNETIATEIETANTMLDYRAMGDETDRMETFACGNNVDYVDDDEGGLLDMACGGGCGNQDIANETSREVSLETAMNPPGAAAGTTTSTTSKNVVKSSVDSEEKGEESGDSDKGTGQGKVVYEMEDNSSDLLKKPQSLKGSNRRTF